MKTVKFFLAAALLAATVLTSCSKDDGAVNSNERVEVKFSSARASVETRVIDNNWAANDPIGIYMLTEGEDDYALTADNISEGVNNRRYKASDATVDGAAASFEQVGGTIYYPANRGGQVVDVKFIAYHPYSSSVGGDFKLPIDVSSGKQAIQTNIDVLYAPAPADVEYNKNSGAVELPFEHKLVKLVFAIENGDGVSAALTGLKVEITGQQTEATLDLTNGDVETEEGEASDITALTADNGESSEAIVLPLSDTGDVNFIFTNSAGEEFTGTVPDATWEGGNKYTYTVKLNKIEAEITGTIADWGAGDGGPVDAK
jgi:hypothetical protein